MGIIFTLITVIKLLSLILNTAGMPNSKKTWTYELKTIEAKTSDSEKLKIDLEIKRISRGVFAVSGTFLINFDIVEGDSNMVSAKSYRSVRGDNEYTVLPFQMPESHVFEFLNTHYRDVIMETVKTCSDLPAFEDEFQPPLEKKEYKLDTCQFSQDGLPDHLQEGLYKLTFIGTGEVDWQMDVTAEISPDI